MKQIRSLARKLKRLKFSLSKPAQYIRFPVDEAWYLRQYPDVAAANMSAVEHYNRYGVTEGRLPNSPANVLRNPAYQGSVQQLVLLLWNGYSHDAVPQLESLAIDNSLPQPLVVLALKSLADWYFCQGQVTTALQKLLQTQAKTLSPDSAVVGGLYRCYITLGEKDKAQEVIKLFGTSLKPQDSRLLVGTLNELLAEHQLRQIPQAENFDQLAYINDFTGNSQDSVLDQPLVSIIVPVFNAGHQVLVAINSLRAQTYKNIEIILVDDASNDATADILHQAAAEDPRIIVKHNLENGGAYVARNSGMMLAKGDFITVHDSDDWSHPQKIERQVAAILDNPQTNFCYSYWVRVLPNLDILGSWMLNNPLIQLNHSSVMYRKEVIEACGLWDEVRVAGDAEYMRRVRLVFGEGVAVLPTVPLSLSLAHPGSLTQTQATHVSSIYYGLRRLYREATRWSHQQFPINAQFATRRRIPAPLGNLPKPASQFETLVVADFSQDPAALMPLINGLDDVVLLHIPASIQRCADTICDEVWRLCYERGISFLHPGCEVSVEQIILQSGDLIVNRPYSLPQVHMSPNISGEPIKILQPAIEGYVSASMVRTLFAIGGMVPSVAELFDTEFYLQQNPDVANAGIAPLSHFLRYGQKEGRAGFSHRALEYETLLWQQSPGSDASEQLIAELKEFAASCQPGSQVSNITLVESAYASWALARWYASLGSWAEVTHFCALHFDNPGQLIAPGHRGPWLLWFNACLVLAQQGEVVNREALLKLQHQVQLVTAQQGLVTDLILAASSVASALQEPLTQREQLKSLWRELDFTSLAQVPSPEHQGMLEFDDLPSLFAQSDKRADGKTLNAKKPLVSVIMPCYNAATSLPTALRSLLTQTWPAIEIIVVDDASKDHSIKIASSFMSLFAQKGIKLIVLKQTFNQGAYAARNRGLEVAKGEFITTHDADDWSHPQKIERQVDALLQDKKRAASMSHWVRANQQLQFSYWRPQSSWVHPNMSSLMFRRSVFKKLGFWDRVSVSGDTEFYYRILAAYGFGSVVEVLPGTPLAFGRHSEASLTQQSSTHIRTQFAGVRHDYIQAARHWHGNTDAPYMPAEPQQRAFEAPALMLRPSAQQIADEIYDNDWYLNQYPDVKAAGVDGKQHFLRWGMAEGRIGGPRLASHQVSEYDGLAWHQGAPVYLVFAHQVTEHQFGAERSLLDVIGSLQSLGRNIVVVVPVDVRSYTTKLRQVAQKVHVQPYTWWHARRDPAPVVQDACKALIEHYQPRAVYANTLTLWEPLLAAGECRVPRWLHVRELADGDEGLCQQLGTDANSVRAHAQALTDKPDDGLIANSAVVAEFLARSERTWVIPNQLDLSAFAHMQPLKQVVEANKAEPRRALRVGMLSSNIAKKGIADVVALSQKLAHVDIEFHLYGPENDYIASLKADGLPDNIHFRGYADHPLAALESLDVVLNLSRFKESFGRTVLEAMAAGRVVLCYDWGALSELVTPGTGFKVPFADIDALATTLNQLAERPELLIETAQSAKARAADFDVNAVREHWRKWLAEVESAGAPLC